MKYIKYRKIESFLERIISRIQKRLHMFPSPRLMVQIDSFDKNGNVTTRCEFKSNSFVRNAYNIIAFQIGAFQTYRAGFGDSYSSLKDQNNGQRDLADSTGDSNESASCCRVGGSGSSSYAVQNSFINCGAIILGTSDNAESINDYALGAIVADGAGVGQLTRGAVSQVSGLWDEANRLVFSSYSRLFTNNSGADIIIKEIGLLNKVKVGATGYVYDVLWARDVLPTPVTIANGEAKTFTYVVKFPF